MSTVAKMTRDELREMLSGLIEQKLTELLGDPDDSVEIRRDLRDRLVRQKKKVARGERGERFEGVVKRLGLA